MAISWVSKMIKLAKKGKITQNEAVIYLYNHFDEMPNNDYLLITKYILPVWEGFKK